jgi:hypothetical protein
MEEQTGMTKSDNKRAPRTASQTESLLLNQYIGRDSAPATGDWAGGEVFTRRDYSDSPATEAPA